MTGQACFDNESESGSAVGLVRLVAGCNVGLPGQCLGTPHGTASPVDAVVIAVVVVVDLAGEHWRLAGIAGNAQFVKLIVVGRDQNAFDCIVDQWVLDAAIALYVHLLNKL